MKYCLNYWRKSQYLNTIEELNINFEGADTSEFENFVKFLANHKEQKINVIIESQFINNFFTNNFDALFNALWRDSEENQHFALRFYEDTVSVALDERVLNFLRQPDRCPAYLGLIAYTVEYFNFFISLGANEVFVGGDLGFMLPIIRLRADKENVKIRVYPNICQGIAFTPSLVKFFIRPNDISIYAPYIDVCELYGKGAIEETAYEAYKEEEWFGPLEQIIYDLNTEEQPFTFDNRSILPQFGQLRLLCQRECMTKGACNICPNIKEISEALSEKGVIIKKSKVLDAFQKETSEET